MIARLFVAFAVKGLVLTSPVMAQQAENAGGPLYEAGGMADAFNMVVATPPSTRPTRPVEVWEWQFDREERIVAGNVVDTIAFHVRIDCAAQTRQFIAAESFLDDRRVHGAEMTNDPQPAIPGSMGHRTVRIACEPGYAASRPTYPDHRAARAAVDQHFADAR